MGSDRAREFDEALRRLVLSHCSDGIVHAKVSATVVWGRPLAAGPGTPQRGRVSGMSSSR
jgi:hypothetical protein